MSEIVIGISVAILAPLYIYNIKEAKIKNENIKKVLYSSINKLHLIIYSNDIVDIEDDLINELLNYHIKYGCGKYYSSNKLLNFIDEVCIAMKRFETKKSKEKRIIKILSKNIKNIKNWENVIEELQKEEPNIDKIEEDISIIDIDIINYYMDLREIEVDILLLQNEKFYYGFYNFKTITDIIKDNMFSYIYILLIYYKRLDDKRYVKMIITCFFRITQSYYNEYFLLDKYYKLYCKEYSFCSKFIRKIKKIFNP